MLRQRISSESFLEAAAVTPTQSSVPAQAASTVLTMQEQLGQRHSDASPKSYFSELTTRNSQHRGDVSIFTQEAIALYVEHCISINNRWFVIGGSEDLRALLSRLEMSDDNNELFILIRPYIHSMGLYLRYESGQIKAFIFDSQNWGIRYHPTRLMIEAIQQHYPDTFILLSGTELQHQSNQRGCDQYALAFLKEAQRCGPLFFDHYTKGMSPLSNNTKVYQQASDQLPDTLLESAMSRNKDWVLEQRKAQIGEIEACLRKYYINDGSLVWNKIFSVVKKRAGMDLVSTKPKKQGTMYNISLNETKLVIQFASKDMIRHSNLLFHSQEIYPCTVDQARNKSLLPFPHQYDTENFTLTYSIGSCEALSMAITSLANSQRKEALYWDNMRQIGGLEELLGGLEELLIELNVSIELKVSIELQKIMQNGRGGFPLSITLSALTAMLETHKNVYVPSLGALAGDNARLPVDALLRDYRFIAFPIQINSDHQAAVWMDIRKKSVTVIDSVINSGLSSGVIIHLERLLGVAKSSIVLKVSTERQVDDWSCGVHVVTNVLTQCGENDSSPIKDRAERYYRAATYWDKKTEWQHEVDVINERHLRELLLLIEDYRHQKGYFHSKEITPNDPFKRVADYLQTIVWGNLNRKDTPHDNTGRKNESEPFLLTQSLRNISTQYQSVQKEDKVGLFILSTKKEDKVGLFVLRTAAMYAENDKSMSDAIKQLLEIMDVSKPVELYQAAFFSQRNPDYYYDYALQALKSEVGMDSKTQEASCLFEMTHHCLTARIAVNDIAFLKEFLFIVTVDREAANAYYEKITQLIKGSQVDSLLLDFLACVADLYLAHASSKKNAKRSNEAERLAFLECKKRKVDTIHTILTQLDITGINPDNSKLIFHSAFIKELFDKHYFDGLTKDEIAIFFTKLMTEDCARNVVVNILALYPGNNPASWEAWLVQKISSLSFTPQEVIEISITIHSKRMTVFKDTAIYIFENLKAAILSKLNAADQNGDTALTLAAANGDTAAVSSLLANGANVNTANQFGNTALILAAMRGHTTTVERLLAVPGIHLAARAGNHRTAAEVAKANNHNEIYHLITTAISFDNFIDAAFTGDVNILQQYIAENQGNPEAINRTDQFGDTALTLAAANGDTAAVSSLLANGANVNTANQFGNTALILAAMRGHTTTVERLLAVPGIHLAARAGNHRTAAEVAKANNHNEIYHLITTAMSAACVPAAAISFDNFIDAAFTGDVNILQQYIAENQGNPEAINRTDQFGDTALTLAAANGDTATVSSLLANGANVNTANQFGNTALILAASYGRTAVVERLLAAPGIHLAAQGYLDRTAAEAAKARNYLEIYHLITTAVTANSRNRVARMDYDAGPLPTTPHRALGLFPGVTTSQTESEDAALPTSSPRLGSPMKGVD